MNLAVPFGTIVIRLCAVSDQSLCPLTAQSPDGHTVASAVFRCQTELGTRLQMHACADTCVLGGCT